MVDPEARHGHKTRANKVDGYKAHVAVEPETGIITAAKISSAHTPDAALIPNLVSDQAPGTEIVADSAYASGPALKELTDRNLVPITKPITRKPRIPNGYSRDDFTIDTQNRTVTCPAGHTVPIPESGIASFLKRCEGCPLRTRCTTSKTGRSIRVDEYHHLRAQNKTRWTQPQTQNTYQRYRPMVERSIAWLTRGKARRVPYRGTQRNQQWLTTRTAAINLQRLTNLGVAYTTTGWAHTPT